ncbi:diaminopimelate decarboxylase [Candidimonas nitroreducens]|uniref:Diaminopimelate decarboxylase n=1 Tax=Candidimonas nitroreducens TaxID=683354 RepID=A0A225MQF4_9BURK|nr:diaminopimelate decarboxylase [Candidimonas nitroreducens]OWT63536.1 diaminopimelate decarboxylase [Candidimonas nitroreducens]
MTVAPQFAYRGNELYAEDTPLARLAQEFGTPLYVYSRQALREAWQAYQHAAEGRNVLICYGMKANSNLGILNEFKNLGAGFDIVSGGELARVLAIGGDPGKIVFSGVGKQASEIQAALQAGVKCFNVESEAELQRLSQVAQAAGRVAAVSLRVNPDVDAQTHPYISTGLKQNKFGIAIEIAPRVYQQATALPGIEVVGVDCHIGSQITETGPYLDALDKLLILIATLADQGIHIKHLDLGGGLGIRYSDETPLPPKTLLDQVFQRLNAQGLGHLQLVLEPGRSLVGNAGVLLTRVEYLKHGEARNFAIVDAAMNDLLRPTLYDAWHGVEPVLRRDGDGNTAQTYDVVGPICESGDWLARDRRLALRQGDLLAIMSAGAYGFVMSSQYNTRPRAAEIMVDGARSHVLRPRETVASLYAGESILPW